LLRTLGWWALHLHGRLSWRLGRVQCIVGWSRVRSWTRCCWFLSRRRCDNYWRSGWYGSNGVVDIAIPPSLVRVAQKRIPQRIPFANFHVLIRGNDASYRRTYIIPQIGTQPQIRDGNIKRVRGTRGDNNGIRKIGQGRDAALPLSCNVSLEYHLVGIRLRI